MPPDGPEDNPYAAPDAEINLSPVRPPPLPLTDEPAEGTFLGCLGRLALSAAGAAGLAFVVFAAVFAAVAGRTRGSVLLAFLLVTAALAGGAMGVMYGVSLAGTMLLTRRRSSVVIPAPDRASALARLDRALAADSYHPSGPDARGTYTYRYAPPMLFWKPAPVTVVFQGDQARVTGPRVYLKTVAREFAAG